MKSKIQFLEIGNKSSTVSVGVARRKFIANLAVCGAAALLPSNVLRAQMPSASAIKPFRIDAHHHFSAPGFIAAISARKTNQRPLELWTPEKSIEDMHKSAVATSMISTSEPSVRFDENEPARKLAPRFNETGA